MNTAFKWLIRLGVALVLALAVRAGVEPVQAQGTEGFKLPPGVTWDEVNQIAHMMYCDVCEGIPLDECETLACAQWREEIARQLGDGRSEDEIIDYFVQRYGTDVASLPRDTGSRLLAYAVPVVIVLIIGALGARQVMNLRRRGQQAGQPVKRSGARLTSRPVPEEIDPMLVERLARDLMETTES